MSVNIKKEIRHKFFSFAVPSVLAMWVYSVCIMIDGMIVSKGVGTTALAALNISMPFVDTVFAIGILLAVGASTKASYYKGEGNSRRASEVFTANTITILVLGIAVSVISLFSLEKLARFLGANGETMGFVKDYLGIVIFFIPCYMGVYNLEVMVKADGFPRLVIKAIAAGAATDVSLEYLLVIALGMGIRGSAVAVSLSQTVVFTVFMIHFIRNRRGFTFVRIRMNVKDILTFAKLGTASFVTELSIGAVIFMFNNVLVRTAGNDGVVIYTVIAYVSQLIIMTMIGINQGMQPLVSFYHGRREKHIYHYILRTALLSAGITSAASFLLGTVYPHPAVGLFIDKAIAPRLYLKGVRAFRLFSLSFLPLGAVIVLSGYFTALEIPKYAMAVSIGRGFVFVIIALWVMALLFGQTGIWLSMGVSETAALILAVALYSKTLRKGPGKLQKEA